MKKRIQKVLSEQGILSRRKTEEYLKKGWIKVNGETVTTLGFLVDPDHDSIELSDQVNTIRQQYVYLMFHKPRGIVTNCPQKGEKDIRSLLPKAYQHVSSIGRLDKDSEGLILLTDDGIFAKKMLTADPPHWREYEISIDEPLTPERQRKLEEGITLFGKKTRPTQITLLSDTRFLMRMQEGKNRQIRRMLQKLGCQVIRLKRQRFANLSLGDLKVGVFILFQPLDVDSDYGNDW